MSSKRALDQLKSVWGKSGLDHIPTPADIKGTMAEPVTPRRGRPKSHRTARLDLRLSPDEKHRLELMALRETVTINELFSRMLELYEREHGRVELVPAASRNE